MSETTKPGAVIHATEETFEAVVLQAQLPVLVKFGADWCPPCRMMEPFLDQFARHYADGALIVEVNKDNAPNLAKTYGVTSIPHLLVFNNGEITAPPVGEDKFDGVGLPDYPMLREWVSEMLTGSVTEATSAETAFAADVEAASNKRDETIANSAESQAFSAAWAPHGNSYQEAVKSTQEALTAETIDQAEYDRRINEDRKANRAAFESADVQAAYKPYAAVSDAAEAVCKTEVLAALDKHFPASSENCSECAAPTGKGFCANGDKACRG